MEGPKRIQTSEEYLTSFFEKEIKPSLDLEMLMKWKKTLIGFFGEENIQITTEFSEVSQHYISRSLSVTKNFCNCYDKRENQYIVYIKFHKFKITNTKKEEREIEDLYIKIAIKVIDERIIYIWGMVPSMTKETYYAGYAHSHIPMQNYKNAESAPYFSNVCLGSGPLRLMTESGNFLNEQTFKLLVLNIREFVKWESIEGTPYYRIGTVVNNATNNCRVSSIWNIQTPIQSNFSHSWVKNFKSLDYKIKKGENISLSKYLANYILNSFKNDPKLLLKELDIRVTNTEINIKPSSVELFVIGAIEELLDKYPKLRESLTKNQILGFKDNLTIYKNSSFVDSEINKNLSILKTFNNLSLNNDYKLKYPKVINKNLNSELFKFKNNPVNFTVIDNEDVENKGTETNIYPKLGTESTKEEYIKNLKEQSKSIIINLNLLEDVSDELSRIFTTELSATIKEYNELNKNNNTEVGNITISTAGPTINIRETPITDQVLVS